jgi:CheY-like chemotaxis protein
MAILNLSVNARDAMPDGGRLIISGRAESVAAGDLTGLAPGRYVRLSVADTGCGMDEETLKRAVEPFYSTKGVGKGTGLGLSMAHGLAAQLGGLLTIESRRNVGTNVELWLPATDAKADDPDTLSDRKGSPAVGTALLVDDEELVRASTAEMLADLGFAVSEAGSAEEALRLIEGGLSFDVLVTDHLMPGMSGTELAREVVRQLPRTRVLIVSGFAEAEAAAPDLPRLVKPFRQSELASMLSAPLENQ